MPIVTADKFKNTLFDYLVLGGGTAGLTLAARLSEDQNAVVGVIEAGGRYLDIPEIDVPGLMGRTVANPLYDWTFLSVPQANANSRAVLQPRGKGLGGSSQINFLAMVRPAKEDLDALQELGNEGWNWSSLLEYMKKSETTLSFDVTPSEAKRYAIKPDLKFHGTSGPIKKSYPTIWTEPHALLFDAAEALGVPRNVEMGNGSNVGSMTSFTSVDTRTASRSYAASGYYEPNAERPNLLVLTNAHVAKVIFQPTEDGLQRAIGAEFICDGTTSVVTNVKREVIISAGTFQTPQILELSGVGNPEILKQQGIEALVDLPGVGENLQDHVCAAIIVELDPKHLSMDVLRVPEQLKEHTDLYKEQKGLLASVPATGFIFVPGKHLGDQDELKALQQKATTARGHSVAINNGIKKQHEFQSKWMFDEHIAQAEILNYLGHPPLPVPPPESGKRYTTLLSALMHPFSRGSVHIGSPDPVAPPLIDPNYFGNEVDLELLLRIVKFTKKLFSTPPYADVIRGYAFPTPDIIDGGDDKLKAWIKDTCGPIFHPIGTAAMLPRPDGGVVDSKLRVYGTTNLRVADLSILPLEVACHTQSLAYAIGEKAADILRAIQVEA